MRGTDVNKNNTKGDVTMLLGAFVGTFQKNVSDVRGMCAVRTRVILSNNLKDEE